jgi:hypothetical protein
VRLWGFLEMGVRVWGVEGVDGTVWCWRVSIELDLRVLYSYGVKDGIGGRRLRVRLKCLSFWRIIVVSNGVDSTDILCCEMIM